MTPRRWCGLILSLMVLNAMPAAAQAQTGSLQIDDVAQDDYPTVQVTITVPPEISEQRLPKEAFTITEDGEERQPWLGVSPETQDDTATPSVVLLIDTSGSMGPVIDEALAAADAFVATLPPGSEVAVVTFGNQPDTVMAFTDDLAQVRTRLSSITVEDNATTALYDGAIEAADLLRSTSSDLPSMVLLSDGGDSGQGSSLDQAVAQLRASDLTLYAVELQTAESNAAALEALAGDAGEVVSASQAEQLERIFTGLASDLSSQYVLKYESRVSGDVALGVQVESEAGSARRVRQITLEGTPARSAESDIAPVARPQPFTVTLPLLGTATAYVVGLVAVALGSLVIWLIVFAPRWPRTRDRLLPEQGTDRRARLSALVEWTTQMADRGVRRSALGDRLDRMLEQAGVDLRPGELVVIVASAMVVAFATGVLASGSVVGTMLAAGVPVVTRLVLSIRRDRRQRAYAEQLTDVLQLMSGTLRAGYGLLQGIDAVARDADEPAAGEFRRILVEHRLGRNLTEAMDNCAQRMNNDDFSWVVQAIGIHRDVGGDLARVLDNIITTIRDRAEVHREVRSLSAEGRLSAIVLTALPFVVLATIQFLTPEYTKPLFERPIGWLLLGLSAVFIVIGSIWVRRLARIRY